MIRSVRRFLHVTLVVALVAGCSRVQLVYSQLDWLIPQYLETYMELSEEQRPLFDKRVAAFLKWHCGTQLTEYADLLREANADFQAGTMTRPRLEAYGDRLELFWLGLMSEAAPAMAEALLSASDEQIDELFEVFEERNEEWLETFEEETDAERRKVYRERVTEELEPWFGPLGTAQQQAVIEWSESFQPLGVEGLRGRQRWQGRLRELIDQRDDPAAFYQGIDELLTNPGALRSQAVKDLYADNRSAIVKLLHEIGRHLSDDQRSRLAEETSSMAGDLEDLACPAEEEGETAGETGVSQPASAPRPESRRESQPESQRGPQLEPVSSQ